MKHLLHLLLLSLLFTSCKQSSNATSAKNDRWLGHWQRAQSQDGAELHITNINGDTLTFILFTAHGASVSELEGTALVKDNNAVFLADAEGMLAECEVAFEMKGDTSIIISEGGSECGNGMYVWYVGVYRKEKR